MEGTRDELIRWLSLQPTDKRYEVKEKSKRRSRTANNYFYELVNEIAKADKMSDRDVHDKLLSENLCFIYRDGTFDWKVCNEKANRFRLLYDPKKEEYWYDSLMRVKLDKPDGGSYIDKQGNPVQGIIYWHVKGSHQMDSKEMSRLIESTIQDAKALGIETMPPRELEKLLGSWKGAKA